MMEPLTGFEPVASSLPRKCSTPELQWLLVFLFPVKPEVWVHACSTLDSKIKRHYVWKVSQPECLNLSALVDRDGKRAGDEARTRDLQLGRLSLYQLSYSRFPGWGEKDSNLRSRKTTDLQSVPVGRFGISPFFRSDVLTEPLAGIEPATY